MDKNGLGMWELKNDILFNKVPQDKYDEFIDFAWNTGCEAAKDCRNKYGSISPDELAVELGLSVVEIDRGLATPDYRVFSEYYSNLKRIVIFGDTIKDEFAKLVETGITDIKDYLKMRELFVAHEIFHHLECHVIGLTSKKKKIVTLEIGPFQITSGVKALCEIGAHGFTKTLLGV